MIALENLSVAQPEEEFESDELEDCGIKVMTFNMLHGRGVPGIKPLRLGRHAVKESLNDIVSMLRREYADVVMLQEVDKHSILTGNFDHAKYLAKHAEYPQFFTGEHVRWDGLLSYGTGLLSRQPMYGFQSGKLKAHMPIMKKGYVIGTSDVLGIDKPVDFVSVHLSWIDYLPKRTRERQARELVEAMQSRRNQNPLVIGGDFNVEWDSREGVLQYIAKELDLDVPVWLGEKVRLPNGSRRCVDWIMCSRDFEIKNTYFVNEKLSDHYPLVAELGVR